MFLLTPDHYSDSQTTNDFESAHVQSPKQIIGVEFYDRSKISRILGLLGIGLTVLVGVFCIVGGSTMFAPEYRGLPFFSHVNAIEAEILSLALNLVVTACTEATGFAHGIALRSALASEKRLRFNTNLRLLSATSGWFNPNSTSLNIVMTVLLIVSYSSSFLLNLVVMYDIELGIHISEVPVIVLGVALLLQAVIALACIWAAWTKILTWSSSPFDLTAALIHHAQITPVPDRSMLSICDDVSLRPVIPSLKQPSAWNAHPSIRKVVMTLWALVVACIVWGLIVAYFSYHDISHAFQSWSFFFYPGSPAITYSIPLVSKGRHGVYMDWALYYVIMAAIQGPLTLALHCSELVVNVIRDERMWKKAMTKRGTTISANPLASVFGNPLNLGLLLAKPLLHWIFGLAVNLDVDISTYRAQTITVGMGPSQILNYAAALLVFSLIFTITVFLRPKGPQPAAYGHVQTLANLIDEFPSCSKMWWGDKGCEGTIRHAGTSSEHPLPEVDMKALYA